jgi:hypothetical protein
MKRNNSMTRLPDEALISAPKNRADMEVVQYVAVAKADTDIEHNLEFTYGNLMKSHNM